MLGIKFDDIHSYDEFGLILTSTSISPPEVKTNIVEVPGADGDIDLTESLTGKPTYKNRKLKFTFAIIQNYFMWESKYSEIMNKLHGKRMQIIQDIDCGYYYVGRVSVNEMESSSSSGKIVIDVDAEPYKYEIGLSNEDWLWDSFCFVDGVITNTNYSVNGSLTVNLLNKKKEVCPVFQLSSDMVIEYENKSYNAKAGTYQNYGILLGEGTNSITFTGTGTVIVSYRMGEL